MPANEVDMVLRFLEELYLPDLELKIDAASFLSQSMESSGTPQELAQQFIKKRLEQDAQLKKSYDAFVQSLPIEESVEELQSDAASATNTTEDFKQEESNDTDQAEVASETKQEDATPETSFDTTSDAYEDLLTELRDEITTLKQANTALKQALEDKNEIIRANNRTWNIVLADLKKTPVVGQTQLAGDASDMNALTSDQIVDQKISESLKWLRLFRHDLQVHYPQNQPVANQS